MRIFISVDMEGISGVEKVEEVFLGLPAYSTFRQVMAGDVNAAVQGAIDKPFEGCRVLEWARSCDHLACPLHGGAGRYYRP